MTVERKHRHGRLDVEGVPPPADLTSVHLMIDAQNETLDRIEDALRRIESSVEARSKHETEDD